MSSETQHNHHFGLQLCRVVPVAQPAVLAEAPGVELAAGREGRAVRAPAGYVPDALGLQGLDQPGLVTVPGTRLNSVFLTKEKRTWTQICIHRSTYVQDKAGEVALIAIL